MRDIAAETLARYRATVDKDWVYRYPPCEIDDSEEDNGQTT